MPCYQPAWPRAPNKSPQMNIGSAWGTIPSAVHSYLQEVPDDQGLLSVSHKTYYLHVCDFTKLLLKILQLAEEERGLQIYQRPLCSPNGGKGNYPCSASRTTQESQGGFSLCFFSMISNRFFFPGKSPNRKGRWAPWMSPARQHDDKGVALSSHLRCHFSQQPQAGSGHCFTACKGLKTSAVWVGIWQQWWPPPPSPPPLHC